MQIKWGHSPKPKRFSITSRYSQENSISKEKNRNNFPITPNSQNLKNLEKGIFKKYSKVKNQLGWGKVIVFIALIFFIFRYLSHLKIDILK
jgi:hypothetical protein